MRLFGKRETKKKFFFFFLRIIIIIDNELSIRFIFVYFRGPAGGGIDLKATGRAGFRCLLNVYRRRGTKRRKRYGKKKRQSVRQSRVSRGSDMFLMQHRWRPRWRRAQLAAQNETAIALRAFVFFFFKRKKQKIEWWLIGLCCPSIFFW